ncbi:MAG TPA: hypothetical protein V6D18_18265 [Thermosynechococcaceae cyanobacterium]
MRSRSIAPLHRSPYSVTPLHYALQKVRRRIPNLMLAVSGVFVQTDRGTL